MRKYINEKPNAKGKEVLKWIEGQETNPWPAANVRQVNQILNRLRSHSENSGIEKLSDPKPDEAGDCEVYLGSDDCELENNIMQKRLSQMERIFRENPEIVLDAVNG